MARPDKTEPAAGNSGEAVDRIFARSEPAVRALAAALIERARALPDVTVDPKGASIHLNRKTAFAGLHPRKNALLLNLRTSAPIESGRIRRVEKVSAKRYHNEMLIESAEALDSELMGWIAQAHALAA